MRKRAKHAPKSLTTSQISLRVVIIAFVIFLIFCTAFYLNHRDLTSRFQGKDKSAALQESSSETRVEVPSPTQPKTTGSEGNSDSTSFTFYDSLTGKEPADSHAPTGSFGTNEARNTPAPLPVPSPSGPGESKSSSENGSVVPINGSTSTDLNFTVQVGSFQSLESAERVLALLREQGFQPTVSPVTLANDKTWYRVRIGSFPVREDAERVMKNLKESQKLDPLILPLKPINP